MTATELNTNAVVDKKSPLLFKVNAMVGEVVKSNRLNTAIQNLSLVELRIIHIGIIDAREKNQGLSANSRLRIDALRYAEAFNVTPEAAYDALIRAESTLFERRFSFLNERENKVKSRWVSQVEYISGEGAIEIIFTPAVVEEITRQGSNFTKFLLGQASKLNSIYSLRLYELLAQHRTNKNISMFDLEILRGQLCLEDKEYRRMSDFKRRVLDLAVNEINEKTDLKVSYEQEKKKGTIIGFKFSVNEKPSLKSSNRDQDTPDLFYAMTEKQIQFFGRELANHTGFGSKYSKVGESQSAFESRIKEELKDPANQQKWLETLKYVGFNAQQ